MNKTAARDPNHHGPPLIKRVVKKRMTIRIYSRKKFNKRNAIELYVRITDNINESEPYIG